MNTTLTSDKPAPSVRRKRMRSFEASPENDRWLTLLQGQHVIISRVINDALRTHCVRVLRLGRRSKNPAVKAMVAAMKEGK